MCCNSHEKEQHPDFTATRVEEDQGKRWAHNCTGDISSLSNGIDEVRFYSPQTQSRI